MVSIPQKDFNQLLKFDKHLQCSGLKYAQPIKTKFCNCHDSITVVTCAKFCCDQLKMLGTRALQSFTEFLIQSQYMYRFWDRCGYKSPEHNMYPLKTEKHLQHFHSNQLKHFHNSIIIIWPKSYHNSRLQNWRWSINCICELILQSFMIYFHVSSHIYQLTVTA